MTLRPRETLTAQLVTALGDRIERGLVKPGEKLPSEQALIEEFGVSRTVVREAISSLKARGLVTTQQGVGAFVLKSEAATAFQVDEEQLTVANEVIAVLELRAGVEVEASFLAAERRETAHLAAMREALDRMAAAIEAGEDTIEPDLEFHRTIADATGNRHFRHLFNYLGALLIPRTRIETFKFQATGAQDYLRRVNREHERIFAAIERGDANAARAAMRAHLGHSRDRLRQGAKGRAPA